MGSAFYVEILPLWELYPFLIKLWNILEFTKAVERKRGTAVRGKKIQGTKSLPPNYNKEERWGEGQKMLNKEILIKVLMIIIRVKIINSIKTLSISSHLFSTLRNYFSFVKTSEKTCIPI